MPYACIGVDVIVGFPGETDDHFQQTYDFLDGLDISYLHVFSYSMRDNTEAVLMKNKIPQDIISERSKTLHHVSMLKKRNFYKENMRAVKQILIEGFENGFVYGHSENYIPVRTLGKQDEVNEIIPVKFIQMEDGEVIGERQI
jgi:threonylcarbamoyladenosine tRNA methylthiotransferase MtaB